MSTIINATTTNGVVIQPDNSGSLVLQSSGTTKATVDSGGFKINGDYAVAYQGMKNRLINGAMQVWQRGTSVTTNGAYTADRWNEVSGNSNQHIQSTDAPTNFGYSMQIIGVGGNINQRIESLNCQDLSGQTITISFWVKNTSGTDSLIAALYYCNSADNFGSLTQIGSNVTISSNPSSSWTQYTTTFTSLPSGSKNGLSLYLIRSGTGAVSTTWYLTGVQLEIGSTATLFERRLYGQELALCQRYYENNYGIGFAVGSAESYPYNRGVYFQSFNTTNGQKHVYDFFKVPKRAVPTVVYYDYAGNAGKITSMDSGGTNTNNVSIGYTPLNQNNLAVGNTATWYGAGFFWTASAEL